METAVWICPGEAAWPWEEEWNILLTGRLLVVAAGLLVVEVVLLMVGEELLVGVREAAAEVLRLTAASVTVEFVCFVKREPGNKMQRYKGNKLLHKVKKKERKDCFYAFLQLLNLLLLIRKLAVLVPLPLVVKELLLGASGAEVAMVSMETFASITAESLGPAPNVKKEPAQGNTSVSKHILYTSSLKKKNNL